MGPVGGPFSPVSASYGLVDSGSASLGWTASANQGWLSLSATSGTLAASGSTTVTASINASANILASGTYSGAITFTDLASGATQTEPIGLTVIAVPVISSTLSAVAVSGEPFSYQITATNSPTSYGAGGLPAGLSVNTATGLISGTTSATGTSNVIISATNAGGGGAAYLNLVVETPYAAWQGQVFSAAQLANPSVSGPTASPAGDGIPNLIKYALGLNPLANGASGLPVASIATTGSGSYLALTYTQVLSATDITYTVQVSTDLQNWNSGSGFTTQPSAVTNAGGLTQTVTVQAVTPIDALNPKEFIRLQVTQP